MKQSSRVSPRKKERGRPVDTYEIADIRAIQALALYAQLADAPWDEKARGGPPPPPPSPADVKRALDWIIVHAAGTYDEPFEPGRPDVTDYLLGRRSVGLAIVKLMRLKPDLFENDQRQEPR